MAELIVDDNNGCYSVNGRSYSLRTGRLIAPGEHCKHPGCRCVICLPCPRADGDNCQCMYCEWHMLGAFADNVGDVDSDTDDDAPAPQRRPKRVARRAFDDAVKVSQRQRRRANNLQTTVAAQAERIAYLTNELVVRDAALDAQHVLANLMLRTIRARDDEIHALRRLRSSRRALEGQ